VLVQIECGAPFTLSVVRSTFKCPLLLNSFLLSHVMFAGIVHFTWVPRVV
jgi:hypothetical protein